MLSTLLMNTPERWKNPDQLQWGTQTQNTFGFSVCLLKKMDLCLMLLPPSVAVLLNTPTPAQLPQEMSRASSRLQLWCLDQKMNSHAIDQNMKWGYWHYTPFCGMIIELHIIMFSSAPAAEAK